MFILVMKKLGFPMEEDDKEDMIVEYLARAGAIVIIGVIIALFVGMCTSCTRTVYVPQTTIQRDSIYITQYKRDSIYMHDSIFQWLKADTMYIEKWHTKYIEKLSTDTLYIEKNDTIRESYPVEKPISTINKVWIKLGKLFSGLGFCAIFLALGYFVAIKRK